MSTAQGERRVRLHATRSLLNKIPLNELFELPGRPHVVYQLRSYTNPAAPVDATTVARNDVPFLFKAFETGQIGPKRMAKLHGGKARVATIHEYLDWTVTAQGSEADDELDFGGFRTLVILPRFIPQYAPADYLGLNEGKKSSTGQALGAPLNPLPLLQTHGKPVCAATIRTGPGYLEIPFVATHEGKRGRGYCRCIVEAIEQICSALRLRKLMLCSTDDPSVKSTWQHLGFSFTSEQEMEEWDVPHSDMVYLQNTVQMHKDLAEPESEPPRTWKPVVIKHGALRVRVYARIGEGRPLLLQHQPPAKRRALPAPGALPTASGALPAASVSLFPAYSTATSLGTNAANGPAASEASGGGGLFGVSVGATGGGGGGYDSKATTQCGSERVGGGGGGGDEPSSSLQYPIMGLGTQDQRAAFSGAGGAPEKGAARAMDAEMETAGAEGADDGGGDDGGGDRMDTDDREAEGRTARAGVALDS